MALLVAGLVLLTGCDPGWRYRVQGSQAVNGQLTTYALPETPGVGGTIRGWAFGVVNREPIPLAISTGALRAVDARGEILRMIKRINFPETIRAMSVVLALGESSRVQREFDINPVFVDGLSRAGRSIPLEVVLEWK